MVESLGGAVAVVAVAVLAILVIWLIPKLQARQAKQHLPDAELPMAENEFRKTLSQIVGGLVLLAGLYFTWEELTTSRVALQSTIRQQEQGRLLQMVTRATDQLVDNEHVTARLGGLYALQRVLIESEMGEDREQVTRIIAAFIRSRAKSAGGQTYEGGQLPQDITAAMEALAARPLSVAEVAERLKEPRLAAIDLRRLNLAGLDLRGTARNRPNLSYLDLEFSTLELAGLDFADVIDADLGGANLRGAKLQNADLRMSVFGEADLTGAELTNADLGGANFDGAFLFRVNLGSVRNLTQNQVKLACMDELTRSSLPSAITPCAARDERGCCLPTETNK